MMILMVGFGVLIGGYFVVKVLKKWVSGQKVVTGVVLVAVVVPFVVYVRDLAVGTTNVKDCVCVVSEWGEGLSDWVTDMKAQAYVEQLEKEAASLQADIEETEQAVAQLRTGGMSDEAEQAVILLDTLARQRQDVMAMKERELLQMNLRRVQAEQRKIRKEQQRAAEAQTQSAKRIVQITLQNRQLDLKTEATKAAAVVDGFLNAVESGKPAEAKPFTSPGFQPQLSVAKLKSLQKSAPEGKYQLTPGKTAGELEAVFGERTMLTLTRSGEQWKVSKVWE